MEPTSNESIEYKILHSGVFKLDGESNPIGIFRLQPKKKIPYTSSINVISYLKNTSTLQTIISELAFEITRVPSPGGTSGFSPDGLFEGMVNAFEDELIALFNWWELTPADLKLDRKSFMTNARKHLKKKKCAGLFDHKQRLDAFCAKDTRKDRHRRDYMVFNLSQLFMAFFPFKITDRLHYVSHLLIACGIEKGSHSQVFDRCRKSYDRYVIKHKVTS